MLTSDHPSKNIIVFNFYVIFKVSLVEKYTPTGKTQTEKQIPRAFYILFYMYRTVCN